MSILSPPWGLTPLGPFFSPHLGTFPLSAPSLPRLGVFPLSPPSLPRLGTFLLSSPFLPRLGIFPLSVPSLPRLGAFPLPTCAVNGLRHVLRRIQSVTVGRHGWVVSRTLGVTLSTPNPTWTDDFTFVVARGSRSCRGSQVCHTSLHFVLMSYLCFDPSTLVGVLLSVTSLRSGLTVSTDVVGAIDETLNVRMCRVRVCGVFPRNLLYLLFGVSLHPFFYLFTHKNLIFLSHRR